MLVNAPSDSTNSTKFYALPWRKVIVKFETLLCSEVNFIDQVLEEIHIENLERDEPLGST